MPRGNGPFAHLDEASLHELAPHGVARAFPKNAVVVNEGDDSDSLYVLLAGRVKVFITGDDGREVVVNVIEAGDYFGELSLDSGVRSASVMTLAPCRFFIIPHGDVEGLLAASPAFAHDLIVKLIGSVRSLTGKVRDLALKDVYGRFVSFVEENAVEHEGERVVPERLTQHDIAVRIGGSREMVSRILRDLTAGGYVAVESKKIRIIKKLPQHW
jgi:CRP/FNR family transcriptional regulator, cyclic AMP receptor protein